MTMELHPLAAGRPQYVTVTNWGGVAGSGRDSSININPRQAACRAAWTPERQGCSVAGRGRTAIDDWLSDDGHAKMISSHNASSGPGRKHANGRQIHLRIDDAGNGS